MSAALACRLTLAALLLTAAPAAAWAHAFAQRYDLPLPLSFWLAGAGAAVALSFVASALALRPAGPQTSTRSSADGGEDEAAWRGSPVWSGLRALSVAGFLALIVAGLIGSQTPHENVLTVTVWILWWVGLTMLVALLGDVWRVVNPLRVIAEWTAALLGRLGARRERPPLTLPASVGVWPAVALFLAFAWSEVVWQGSKVPVKLAIAILLYAGLTWIAMALVGIETWLARGEAFSRFFALVGRVAPLDVVRGRRAGCRGRPVAEPARHGSEAVLILLVLATLTFDGLRETAPGMELKDSAMAALRQAGIEAAIGYGRMEMLVMTAGMLAVIATMLAAYLVTCSIMAAVVAPVAGTRAVALAFAGSLVPIAVGYHIAHYISYLLIQGQWIFGAVSDPFGRGWNLFGTRGLRPDIGIIDAGTVWWIALATIVLGHVAAVVLAHRTALHLLRRPRVALASQYPMLVLMVGYTVLSLWIMAEPIVSH